MTLEIEQVFLNLIQDEVPLLWQKLSNQSSLKLE